MTRFVLIRHGQTEWNRVERFRGRADIPLNDTGIRQAQAVAERLAGMPVGGVYSSPLGRGLATADPIARRLGLSVQVSEGLTDFNFGDWQGMTPDDVAGKYHDLYRKWLEAPRAVRVPGGESLDEVTDRAMATITDLAARLKDQTIVLVSHKVVCKAILLAVMGLDNSRFWRIEQDNAAINVFEFNERGGFTLLLMNDVCHLTE